MWWNENGWKDIEKGRYDRAEQKFKMAIKEIEPYCAGQSETHGADVLRPGPGALLPEAVRRRRAAGGLGALGAQRRQEGDAPTRSFSACSPSRRSMTALEHYADAEPNWKRALSLQEKELSGSHVNTLLTLDRLGFVLRSQGKYHEAEPFTCGQSRSMSGRRRTRTSTSPIRSINTSSCCAS